MVDRLRHDRGLRPLLAAAMVAFVLVVYLTVVVGGGLVLGYSGGPSLWLSVFATAIVAIAFEPVRRRVKRWLAHLLKRDRMSPYQVLAHFPKSLTGAVSAEALPGRIAKVLAEGTGATRAEVWLVVHGRLELAAVWPGDPTDSTHQASNEGLDTAPAGEIAALTPPNLGIEKPGAAPDIVVDGLRHSLAVRERGELLGALTVVIPDGQQLSPVEERLFAGLAAQSGLMLRDAGLRAELRQQLLQLDRRTEELRTGRRDLVARQDAERQRLERNIHDGAQQEVLALLVNLRLAQALATRAPERAARVLAEQAAAARATIDTLSTLSRGLYPPLLTDAGPVAALRAAVASGPIPVHLTSPDLPRCPPDVEAAVYFACLEAVQNASKYSAATSISIDIQGRRVAGDTWQLEFSVADDGRGFDLTAATGHGLLNIRDRIESVGGTVALTSAPGAGTTVTGRIPRARATASPTPETSGTSDDHVPDAAHAAALPTTGR